MVIDMPIYTKAGLPVNEILRKEKIQILEELEKANSSEENNKVLEVAILNLMPLKEDTELQLLRKLSASGKSIKITFVKVSTYTSKTTAPEHMQRFYSTFGEIQNKYFDGLIITGAPVEQMEFEEVDYWAELRKNNGAGQKLMQNLHFIYVGELKLGFIIIME